MVHKLVVHKLVYRTILGTNLSCFVGLVSQNCQVLIRLYMDYAVAVDDKVAADAVDMRKA